VAEYTISSADTWEKKTITLTLDQSGGTEAYTIDAGLRISWALAMGSDFNTTAGTWQNGNFYSTSNQVNFMDNAANTMRLAMIQLEAGSVATEFERRFFADEMTLCQRYYEKSFDYDVAPAQNTGDTNGALRWVAPVLNTAWQITVRFSVPKHDTPTIGFFNPSAANANWSAGGDAGQALGIGKSAFSAYSDSPTIAAGSTATIHWAAAADF
jgi:hypothetical protein